MTKDELRQERVRLEGLLETYESGRVSHFDEDDRGELNRDTTAERISSVKDRIAEIDRKLADDWRD